MAQAAGDGSPTENTTVEGERERSKERERVLVKRVSSPRGIMSPLHVCVRLIANILKSTKYFRRTISRVISVSIEPDYNR